MEILDGTYRKIEDGCAAADLLVHDIQIICYHSGLGCFFPSFYYYHNAML